MSSLASQPVPNSRGTVARADRRQESMETMTPPQGQFTLGLVQMACGPDPAENLEKAVTRVRQAARDGAQIICLQELFRSLYFCQRQDPSLFDLAEPIPGPTTERLAGVAREAGVVVVASVFERRAAGV